MGAAGSEIRTSLSAMAADADDALDLAGVALNVAALNHPGIGIAGYVDHLDALAGRLTGSSGGTAPELAEAVVATLSDTYGYRALDDEDDAADVDLMDTIDTRAGSPECLGLVVLHVLGGLGMQAQALAFPSRFLVRLDDGQGARVILDPLDNWATIEAHHMRAWLKAHDGLAAELTLAHHLPLSRRAVLVRLQNGAKLRHLRAGRLDRALEVIETTLLFAPASQSLWREAGILHARLNHYAAAVNALEHFLAHCDDRSIRARTQRMLAELRQHLN